MLRWYLRGTARGHGTRNRAFVWLLAGVAAVCAVLLVVFPQLGFAHDTRLGLAAVVFAALALWAVCRARRGRGRAESSIQAGVSS